jgi:catechol 2,3-dioxygenase
MASDVNIDLDSVTKAEPTVGVNHLVLNVRNIDESHKFWTEILGFELCGVSERNRANRFYHAPGSGSHHDIALFQLDDPGPEPPEWNMRLQERNVNHIAIAYPDRESWLRQVAWMMKNDVKMRRVDHGMTHSVYISDPNGFGLEILYELPQEVWENDINAALNWAVGYDEILQDDTDYKVFEKGELPLPAV